MENDLAWRKSNRCDTNTCLEVTPTESGVLVRNNQNPAKVLAVATSDWDDFLGGIRDGSFDSLG